MWACAPPPAPPPWDPELEDPPSPPTSPLRVPTHLGAGGEGSTVGALDGLWEVSLRSQTQWHVELGSTTVTSTVTIAAT
jgi:hypothetical protein